MTDQPTLSDRPLVPMVIWIILGLCLLPELVLSGADLGLWGTAQWRIVAYQNGGFWTGLLHNWRPNYASQPWLMFLTYGLLHGGLIHFGLNMLTLWSLGPPLVQRVGQWRFAAVYLAAQIGGAAGFAVLSPSSAPMVGASGALFGLAGLWLGRDFRQRRRALAPLWPVLRSVLWLAALNLVVWWLLSGQLAWETHLGGFLTGWLCAGWAMRSSETLHQK